MLDLSLVGLMMVMARDHVERTWTGTVRPLPPLPLPLPGPDASCLSVSLRTTSANTLQQLASIVASSHTCQLLKPKRHLTVL